jgi:AcrR family transcriptional regulator
MMPVIVKEEDRVRDAERRPSEDGRERRSPARDRGLDGTAFSDVIARSGAPRGSIYHHFPDGKDELVAAAIALAGDRAIGVLEPLGGAAACRDRVVPRPLAGRPRPIGAARRVRGSGGHRRDGLAGSAGSRRGIFRAWHGKLTELYVAGGLDADAAARLATT